MAFNRDDTLKKAEKLLRQGKLEPAIAEYVRVAEADPADWMTANTLGDLYGRAGQTDQAAAQYTRVARHFLKEGFYPKAAAIYKKLLKLRPDDEQTQLALADISQQQGLLGDAKAYLNAVAARRRERGDRAGAAEIVVRLGSVDPNDFEARLAAARSISDSGDDDTAAARFREIYDDLLAKDRPDEALAALREAVRRNPHDQDGRATLARASIAAGDLEGARDYLDPATAGGDPELLRALLQLELGAGRADQARELARQLLAAGGGSRQTLIDLAWSMGDGRSSEAAFVLIDEAVDQASAAGEYAEAAALLREFVTRIPQHVPALMKSIEVCVDGGLEAEMTEAQGQLADAYLSTGQPDEARVIAEDLVAREPWDRNHIDRFRRALVMLKVPEPDMVIAERLSGFAPFTARDVFARGGDMQPVAPASPPRVDTPDAVAPPPAAADPAPFAALIDQAPAAPEQLDIEPATEEAGAPEPPRVPLSSYTPDPEEPVAPAQLSAAEETELDLDQMLSASSTLADPTSAAVSETAEGGLDDVFQGLRDQASNQAGADQAAQSMTLARTYLEMGLPDEAIPALKDASRSPAMRFESASILGRLYRDRGQLAEAAEWLERASEAPAPSTEDGWALFYDFGAVLEENGETARALAIFLEIQSEAGDYRDVAARVERLSRVETETGG